MVNMVIFSQISKCILGFTSKHFECLYFQKEMLRVCASTVDRIPVLCEIFVYVCEKACQVEKIIYPKGLNDLIF